MAVKIAVSQSLSNSETKYLDRAIALAKLSTMRQKHGAIIVKSGRILSMGFNTSRNDPISNYPSDSYSVHAEQAAIKLVGERKLLTGSRIFIARVSRRGLTANSRPCDSCMASILSAGIKSVIYTT